MFENAFNLRGFAANNFIFSPNVHVTDENLRATFNEATIKTFSCRVDPYLVILLSEDNTIPKSFIAFLYNMQGTEMVKMAKFSTS